ncbi:hypothetical protein Tco_1501927 [Tanacetum coccineum]
MMANLSEDTQSVGFDTRPPMLDRSNFESWQQRIHLYCLGKENGENILQSIDEGPFKMGKFRETLADSALGPERDRVVKDLTPEEKERFTKLINDMRNIKMTMPKMQLNSKFVNNMLPEWGRFVTAVKLNKGLKTSNYDQLYAYLKQHEAHANENKIMLEKYTQHAIDPLAFMAEENVPTPTRIDEQLVPVKAHLPIGKRNLLVDLQKMQKNPIFRISVDILQNTNFFSAFTASADVPSIYIQQFWNTLGKDYKTCVYSFQLDE